MDELKLIADIIIDNIIDAEDFTELSLKYIEKLDAFIKQSNEDINYENKLSFLDCHLQDRLSIILKNKTKRAFILEYCSRLCEDSKTYINKKYISAIENENTLLKRKKNTELLTRYISINLLLDHIYNYIKTHISNYAIVIDEFNKGIKSSSESSSDEINKVSEELNRDLENAKKEIKDLADETKGTISKSERKIYETSIAVLGVFSAIVLAFNGSLALSSSAVEGLNAVSPYRLVLFILLLGFVLINVLFALFYFVNAIIIRNRTNSNSEDKQLNKKYIIITDIIILALVGITVCAWYFDVIGSRDEYIKEKYSVSESADTDDEKDEDKGKSTTQPSDESESTTVKKLVDGKLETETTTKKHK